MASDGGGFAVLPGQAPVVLLAPHAGRRDHARLPWGSRPLKMNDLHTGSLTRELATRTRAHAIVNDHLDRNQVDLNRLSSALAHARPFLVATADAIEHTLARAPRMTLFTVHGWNVGEPVVDLGIGVRPDRTDDPAAIAPAFRADTLAALMGGCGARGIRATVGARYPARGAENLIQLFTGRHRDHGDPLVRRITRHADRVDAVQLELGLPLRFPGPWRDRFLDAIDAALAGRGAPSSTAAPPAGAGPGRLALQVVAPGMTALVRIGPEGGLLLLFPRDGSLVAFTGERVGPGVPPDGIGGLRCADGPNGAVVRYAGPCLHYPDTRAFEDLESGLLRARAVEVSATVAFHATRDGFGAVQLDAEIDGTHLVTSGSGFASTEMVHDGWPVRGALHLADDTAILLGMPDPEAPHPGRLIRRGIAIPILETTLDHEQLTTSPHPTPLDLRLASNEHLRLFLTVRDRLPVVRNTPGSGARRLHASCLVNGADHAAGWLEVQSR